LKDGPMLFELLAAVFAGLALAGIAMSLRWISRQRLPKWIVPVAAGSGMLLYSVWSEYSWLDRTVNSMPSVAVAWQSEDRAPWRPWSYVKPLSLRFTGVDRSSVQRHPAQPGQVMVDLVFAARWQPLARVKVVYDCNGHRRADVLDQPIEIAPD